MPFKIGMRIPPKLGAQGMEKVAAWAAEAGLDVIDVPYYNSELKSILESQSLQVGSIDGAQAVGRTHLLSNDEQKRGEAVAALKAQFTEIARLGGKTVFMCLVPDDLTQPRDTSFEIWKETFPELVQHAEQEGIFMALEGWPGPAPHYPTIGCTPEMLRAMFREIPSQHFGVNYDPSHLVRLGIDYIRFLGEFGERINYCHGKDTEILTDELFETGHLAATFAPKYLFSEGSWRYTIPGSGEVDWGKVAVRLERLGYQGPISIELEDHRYWGSLEAEQTGIVKARVHLTRYFK
ncbi:sugar phosphate isomerase/epimerase family protein [Paenibacillus xerothermodurans]|uniref:Sugar phosphate isomerase/epimerase n=1 Tax=Paenibacillus xerothermodurans TaxID=1977292 RepID=A0A2W1NAX9_PAEXE|nr:sugar phosphate isomerase/epimerase [Paenibacillus xerothermodurans]PZE21577.1 sugar phosphate isomerase/epimerase [Paenibacillus xerothermodurans]